GSRETTLLKAASPADYEAAIIATTGSDLKLLLLQSMDIFRKPEVYESHFGGAGRSFLEACRSIVASKQGTRLARLIHLLFHDAGCEAELEQTAGGPSGGDTNIGEKQQ